MAQSKSAVPKAEVKLGQFQIAGLGNFQVDGRAVDDGDGEAGTFDDGGFVGTDETIGRGLGESALQETIPEALRSLREHDELAGNGGGDQGAVRGALDLLDGVDRGHSDDGGAVLDDGVDGAVDGGGIDERADGIVDEDNVVGLGGEGEKGVGNGLLAMVTAFDDVNAVSKTVLGDLGLTRSISVLRTAT